MSNGRRNKKVPHSRRANSRVSKRGVDRMPSVPKNMGSEVRPNGEAQIAEEGAGAGTEIVVAEKFPKLCSQSLDLGRSEAFPREGNIHPAIIVRDALIEQEYEGEEVAFPSSIPLPAAELARAWLKSKHLAWCAHDQEFWDQLGYLLGSLETFGVDAVESALILCLANVSGNTRRREEVYKELLAVREIKKARTYELNLKTSHVLAKRLLLSPRDVANGARAKLCGTNWIYERRKT